MLYQEFHFHFYSTTFYGQYWKPEQIKAIVLLLHGMGEHSGRYADFVIPTLLKHDIAVVAFDQFGHGKTEGKRGQNPNYTALLDSVSVVLNKSKEFFGDHPTFLYGHCMGGNIVLNYALQRQTKVKGIIATSPLLKLTFQPPNWKVTMDKFLQKIHPSRSITSTVNAKDISRDQQEVEKFVEDPLIHDKIDTNYSITFLETGKWAVDNARMMEKPTFIAHGTADKIMDYKASILFASKSSSTNIKLYKGAYHELHKDLCKDVLLEDMITWMHPLI